MTNILVFGPEYNFRSFEEEEQHQHHYKILFIAFRTLLCTQVASRTHNFCREIDMASSGALFGSSAGSGGAGGRGGVGGKNLLEFRAGKMTMKGKMVTADKRKGLLYINQAEDGLMHFCWKERTKPATEDVSSRDSAVFFVSYIKYIRLV